MKRIHAQGTLDRSVRAQFEYWYSDGGKSPKAIERKPGANGAYIYSGAATAWDVWQAAAEVERETCSEVCEEKHVNGNWKYDTRHECAVAIRERVKETGK